MRALPPARSACSARAQVHSWRPRRFVRRRRRRSVVASGRARRLQSIRRRPGEQQLLLGRRRTAALNRRRRRAHRARRVGGVARQARVRRRGALRVRGLVQELVVSSTAPCAAPLPCRLLRLLRPHRASRGWPLLPLPHRHFTSLRALRAPLRVMPCRDGTCNATAFSVDTFTALDPPSTVARCTSTVAGSPLLERLEHSRATVRRRRARLSGSSESGAHQNSAPRVGAGALPSREKG